MSREFTGPPEEFIVYDLEYTAWPGSREREWSASWEFREVVEIGAMRLLRDGKLLKSVAKCSALVRPTRNPFLSEYFTNLTGIDQSMVDTHGVTFVDAMSDFAKFAHGAVPLLSFGEDDEVLLENCRLCDIECVFEPGRLINYRQWLRARLGIHDDVFSCDLPSRIGLDQAPNRRHRAIDDVYAQVLALAFAIGAQVENGRA